MSFYNSAGAWQTRDSSIWSLTRVKWWIILYTGAPRCTRGATLTPNLLKTPAQQPSVIINQSTCHVCWRCEQTQMEIHQQQQQPLSQWTGLRESYRYINTGTLKVQSSKITTTKIKHMFSLTSSGICPCRKFGCCLPWFGITCLWDLPNATIQCTKYS